MIYDSSQIRNGKWAFSTLESGWGLFVLPGAYKKACAYEEPMVED